MNFKQCKLSKDNENIVAGGNATGGNATSTSKGGSAYIGDTNLNNNVKNDVQNSNLGINYSENNNKLTNTSSTVGVNKNDVRNTNVSGSNSTVGDTNSASNSSVGNLTTGASTATVGNVSTGASNSTVGNVSTGASTSNSNQSQSTSNSNNSSVVVEGDEAQKRNPVSTAYAGSLTSGIDTCMGSSTAGAQGVGFGISLGSTWTDKNCTRLKSARQLDMMGYKEAAVQVMCLNKEVEVAMKAAGTPCSLIKRKD